MAKATEAVLIEKEKTNRALVEETISGFRQVGVVMANSPVFQMIAGLLTVELLQRIQIRQEPIISDTLANAMTGFIIAREATSSVSDIINIISPFD